MSMPSKNVCIVMPTHYGVGFVEAAHKLGHNVFVLVNSMNCPQKYGYDNWVDKTRVEKVNNVFDADSVAEGIDKLASKVDGGLDAVIPGTDYVTSVTAKASKKLNFISVSPSAAELARNKDKARKALNEKFKNNEKFYPVDFVTLSTSSEIEKVPAFPRVIKPVDCAAGQHVREVTTPEELEHYLAALKDFNKSYLGYPIRREFIVEEKIDGPEYSVEIFLFKGLPVFSSLTKKSTSGSPKYVEIGHVILCECELEEVLVKGAVESAKALGFQNGPLHVELRLNERGQVAVMEINGRPAGDMIAAVLLPTVFGINLFELTIQMYLGEQIDEIEIQRQIANVPKRMPSAAIRFAFNFEDRHSVRQEPDWPEYVIDAQFDEAFWNQQHPKSQSSEQRNGFVIVAGDTPKQAEDRAREQVERLFVEESGITKN